MVLIPIFTIGLFEQSVFINILLLLPFFIPLLIFIALIHAAYNTTYTINNNILEMKCGFVIKGKIEIDRITDIKNSRFNIRMLGISYGEKGYCNRFTDGLILNTIKGKIYLSPSDNERFKYELDLK